MSENISSRLISQEMRDGLIRFCRRGSGLAVLITGIVLAMALGSYNPADASFNTVSSQPVTNMAGLSGAYVSDILVQYFGKASWLFPIAVMAWGLLIFRLKWSKLQFLRVAFFLPTLVVLISLLTCLSVVLPSFVPAGSGGALAPAVFFPVIHVLTIGHRFPESQWLFIPVLFLASFFGLALTLGIPFSRVYLWIKKLIQIMKSLSFLFKRKQQEEIPVNSDVLPEGIMPKHQTELELDEPEDAVSIAPKKSTGRRRIVAKVIHGEKRFELPPLKLLSDAKDKATHISREYLEERKQKLLEVLKVYRVTGDITGIHPGPVVTLFEFKPTAGIKTARIIGLTDEIAREMKAKSVRMALVPGEDVIGIELPNEHRASVYLKEMFESPAFKNSTKTLTLALGKNIGGTPTVTDLAKMPHLLVAGTTGSGKSVAINTMIMSLLYRLTPEQVRLIMIDPKMLELSVYNGIPHLLTPVVTDPRKAVLALNWAVREMEDRYLKMSQMNVRNIEGYNKKVAEEIASCGSSTIVRSIQTGFDAETGQPVFENITMNLKPFPYIVVIVDEMADLMLTAGKEIEVAIQRIAQKARASGIHLIMATQRPSVDVITGTIKANFPERISFRVTTKIDSRTILNEQGAEQLLGMGDMLYSAQGQRPTRLHGPFVSDEEVEQITAFLREQGVAEYVSAVVEEPQENEGNDDTQGGNVASSGDELYDKAVDIVLRDRKPTISYIQRRLQIGYNKAAGLIERMETEGVVSAPNVAGKREILVPERT